MKKLLLFTFLIISLQTALSQTNPLADERRVQGLKDTLNRRIDSVKVAIGTIEGGADTRIDSLKAVVRDTNKIHSDTLLSHNDRINAVLDSVKNKYTKLDTRTVIADSLYEIRDSLGVRYTKTDTRSVVHDSVSFARDSIATHRTELNALMDSTQNKYTESDTRIVIADSLAEMRDSVANRYTKAEIDGMGFGGGTVTNIATSDGLTGGTITTTGTIKADTTFLVTKWDTLSLSNRINTKSTRADSNTTANPITLSYAVNNFAPIAYVNQDVSTTASPTFANVNTKTLYENEPVIFKSTQVQLLSPYTTKTNVYRGQMHTHSTGSDGVQSPTGVATFYKNAGYNFLAITDHDVVTADPSVSGILFIRGVEQEIEGFHTNQINITTYDTATTIQGIIDTANYYGTFIFLNHPYWQGDHWTFPKLESVDGYYGIEVWNSFVTPNNNGEAKIDSILSKHRKTYLLANDDLHDTTQAYAGTGSVYVFANTLTNTEIMANLKAGNFYSSNGATITSITVSGQIINIVTGASSTISFIGKNGITLQSTATTTTASYTVTGAELYVRIRVTRDSDGKMAWSNPIYINDDSRISSGRVSREKLIINDNSLEHIRLRNRFSFIGNTSLRLTNNAWFDGSNYKYTQNAVASMLTLGLTPSLTYSTAVTGLVNTIVPFVDKFMIDKDGNITIVGDGTSAYLTFGSTGVAMANYYLQPLSSAADVGTSIMSKGAGNINLNYNNSSTGSLIFYGGGTNAMFSVNNTGVVTTGTAIDTAYLSSVSKLNNGVGTTVATGGGKTYKVDVDTASTIVSKNYGGNQYEVKGTAVLKATMPTVIGIACSDETTALTASTSVAKVTFRVPYAMTVTAVRASVTTAPTGSTILVDIHESGTTILSTKIMIDASEFTSTTAATPYVLSDTALADDSEITVYADQVGSSVAGAGLKIWIIGTRIAP